MIDEKDFDEHSVSSWHKQDYLLTKEEYNLLKIDFYNAFNNESGKRVLGKLLSDLCFFRRCENPDEVALNNYAKKLLSYLGDWEIGSEDSIISKLLGE